MSRLKNQLEQRVRSQFLAGMLAAFTIAAATTQTLAQPDTTAQGAYAGVIKPDDVMTLAMAELQATWDRETRTAEKQRAIVTKYLPFIAPDINEMPADPRDQLALGNMLFYYFIAVDAEAHFEGLMDRTDIIGRIAYQRVMQIRRRAFGRVDEARELLDAYKNQFTPSSYDLAGRAQQVRAFATSYLDNDDADSAIDLILDELNWLPADGAYRSFWVPLTLWDKIAPSPRADEVRAAIRQKLQELKAFETKYAARTISAEKERETRALAPNWYWISLGVKRGEGIHTTRLAQVREMIERIEAWLAQ